MYRCNNRLLRVKMIVLWGFKCMNYKNIIVKFIFSNFFSLDKGVFFF